MASNEVDSDRRIVLANLLRAIAEKISEGEAATIIQVIRPASLASDEAGDLHRSLTACLAMCASRLAANERSKLLHQMARAKIQSFVVNPTPEEFDHLSHCLPSLLERMSEGDAARVCTQAEQAISAAAAKHLEDFSPVPKAFFSVSPQVELAAWMKPDDANRICGQTVRTLLEKSEPTAQAIIEVLPHLDPAVAKKMSRELAVLVLSGNTSNPDVLHNILDDVGRPSPVIRRPNTTVQDGTTRSSNPLPCRLTTQELVELLKMPTCFGEARRVVLDHLGNIHGQRFTNHWSFVRFVREKGLNVDLTTPPKRPDRQESVKRMLAILDEKP